ncbi:chorismate mutase [Peptoniphilus timonensis]|uniref:chorismate mutase n=1 Tax=Peptoniphilus timonensis TaxID=1268254 RepID=UPI0002D4FB38|nr:chorismate mutase [Peptoniphilus timonensis]
MRDLREDRKILDEIDSKIISLLENRMEIVKEVGSYKLKNNLNIEDKNREKFIIEKLEKAINPEFKNIVEPIYSEIFKESKKLTSKIKR